MIVGIADLGINNLSSVQRGFSIGLTVSDTIAIIDRGKQAERPDLLILPGLGKFDSGMAALYERNLVETIMTWNNEGTKVVGICLGMQLLGADSEESPNVPGLNLINSRVERLPIGSRERIPHTGWASVTRENTEGNFPSLSTPGDFYFVHSFHLVPENRENVLTRTTFGKTSFASSVISKSVLGFQFHPEKSGSKGKALISEIIQWARNED